MSWSWSQPELSEILPHVIYCCSNLLAIKDDLKILWIGPRLYHLKSYQMSFAVLFTLFTWCQIMYWLSTMSISEENGRQVYQLKRKGLWKKGTLNTSITISWDEGYCVTANFIIVEYLKNIACFHLLFLLIFALWKTRLHPAAKS